MKSTSVLLALAIIATSYSVDAAPAKPPKVGVSSPYGLTKDATRFGDNSDATEKSNFDGMSPYGVSPDATEKPKFGGMSFGDDEADGFSNQIGKLPNKADKAFSSDASDFPSSWNKKVPTEKGKSKLGNANFDDKSAAVGRLGYEDIKAPWAEMNTPTKFGNTKPAFSSDATGYKPFDGKGFKSVGHDVKFADFDKTPVGAEGSLFGADSAEPNASKKVTEDFASFGPAIPKKPATNKYSSLSQAAAIDTEIEPETGSKAPELGLKADQKLGAGLTGGEAGSTGAAPNTPQFDVESAWGKIRHSAQQVGESAQQLGHDAQQAGQQAREYAQQLGHEAVQVGRNVSESTQQLASGLWNKTRSALDGKPPAESHTDLPTPAELPFPAAPEPAPEVPKA
jgi:hypothetical protein